jgi:hypothetical protein
MPADTAQGDETAIRPERGTETVVAAGRRRCLAELPRLLNRDRPLNPEKGSRDLRVRVQRFHERSITSIQPAKLESIRSQRHRWSHSLIVSGRPFWAGPLHDVVRLR